MSGMDYIVAGAVVLAIIGAAILLAFACRGMK